MHHACRLLILVRESKGMTDRKSTRLNSSHQIISYAVFCLKKKKKLIKCALARTRAVAGGPHPHAGGAHGRTSEISSDDATPRHAARRSRSRQHSRSASGCASVSSAQTSRCWLQAHLLWGGCIVTTSGWADSRPPRRLGFPCPRRP